MKLIFNTFLSLFLLCFLTIQPALAGDHGHGGDEKEEKNEAPKAAPVNPEKKVAPTGFSNEGSAVNRSYKVNISSLTAAQIQFLKSKGYLSQEEQRDHGNKDWSDRATKKSQKQWEKHMLTALDGAAINGGISLVDANAMDISGVKNAVSKALANAAWALATSHQGSSGEGVSSGLGMAVNASPQFSNARNASTLKNLSK